MEVAGRFGPKPFRTLGRFGPESFRPGRFGLGRFGPILVLGRFGQIGGSFRPIFFFGPNFFFGPIFFSNFTKLNMHVPYLLFLC